MRRTAPVTLSLLAAIAALALSGCSASNDSAMSGAVELTEQSGGAFSTADSPAEMDAATADTERSVITTGWMTVVVDDPAVAATEAISITEAAGGRVDGREERAAVDGQQGSATLTLRIPSTALTASLDRFEELGEAREVSLSSSDVTREVQDLDARITALAASIERLTALLATATDTEALITLETAISDRQGQLESMQSQQRYLADQVSMSTLTLSLVSVAEAPALEPAGFLDGLAAGWNALVAFLAGLVVVVGVLLPWLVLLALLGGIVWLVLRARRRRRAAAPTTAGPDPIEPGPAA